MAWLERHGSAGGLSRTEVGQGGSSAVDRVVREWLDDKIPAAQIPAREWSTFEWLRFLHALPEQLPSARMAELDAAFKLTDRRNSEIASQWLLHAIRSGYRPADDRLEAFLTTVPPPQVPLAALWCPRQGRQGQGSRHLREGTAPLPPLRRGVAR